MLTSVTLSSSLPSLLLIRTRREVEETGDGDQATTSEHAEVDTAGQWWTTLGAELPEKRTGLI